MGACGSSVAVNANALQKTIEVPGLKIAMVGDPETGKSCILTRYIHNRFSPVYIPTQKAALENVVQKLNVPGHATVIMTLWDIPGKEDLPLYQTYFRNVDAVIVVVDVSDISSIETGRLWHQKVLTSASTTVVDRKKKDKEDEGSEVLKNGGVEAGEDGCNKPSDLDSSSTIPFLLLGNKFDLIKDQVMTDANNQGEERKNKVIAVESTTDQADCMNQFEQISKEGFVGGVLVSAKSNDLSVHTAIQNFLRHILEKKYVERRWRPLDKTVKTKHPRYEMEPQLSTVGIEEIDAVFSDAETIVQRVSTLQLYQRDALNKFRESCVAIEVIEDSRNASLQNCLVGLRDKLDSLEMKLKFNPQEDFYLLEVKASTENAELERPVRLTVKAFNKEYAAITLTMLREYPVAQRRLVQIDRTVKTLCQQYQIPNTTSTSTSADTQGSQHMSTIPPSQLKKSFESIEKNRAVMCHVLHECHDSLAHIHRIVKQTKAAFVW